MAMETGTLPCDGCATPDAMVRRGGWLLIPVIVAGAVVYAGSLNGPFIFDDLGSIPNNRHLRQLWPLTEAMSAPSDEAVSGRPVVSLSLAVNYALGELEVRGYHLFNIAVHLLCAATLFGIVRRTLWCGGLVERFGRSASYLAAAVASIWALHPLQTEAVSYVIQRTELLMGLFYLLTLYGSIRAFESPHRRVWFAVAIASCALGMGSKEVMVSAPLAVLLYDRAFVSRSFAAALRRHRILYAGLAATWAILAVLVVSTPRAKSVGLELDVDALDYLRTQAGVVLWYLRLCLWPDPLVISYADWPVASGWTRALPQGMAVLALLGATLWALWRRAEWGVVGAWFFMILAPTSSVLPIVTELAAERRMYLPLAAVVVAAVFGGWWCVNRLLAAGEFGRRRARGVGVILVLAVASFLGWRTAVRNFDYRSAVAIWRAAVEDRPENPVAHSNLGLALHEDGDFAGALEHLAETLRLQPDAKAHYNLGAALAKRGRTREAVEHLDRALRISPDYAQAHNALGMLRQRQGKLEEATARFREALRLRPVFTDAHNNLGMVLAALGRTEEAMSHFREALRIDPDLPLVHNNLGMALAGAGRTDEAIAELRAALSIDPTLVKVWVNLGNELARKGRIDLSIDAFHYALGVDPDHAEAHCFLGFALASRKELDRATEEFRIALRIDPDLDRARKGLEMVSAMRKRP